QTKEAIVFDTPKWANDAGNARNAGYMSGALKTAGPILQHFEFRLLAGPLSGCRWLFGGASTRFFRSHRLELFALVRAVFLFPLLLVRHVRSNLIDSGADRFPFFRRKVSDFRIFE